MNNKSRTLICMLCIAMLFLSQGCKKKSNSSTVIGNWKLSGYSGTNTYNNDSTSGSTTTYSYSNGTLTESVIYIGSTVANVSTVVITTENWSINNDGTYTITELYTNSGSTPNANNTAGTWDYLSNSKSNNTLVLSGSGSSVLNNGGTYTIQSVSGNQLILTSVYSNSGNGGYLNSNNVTWTFTKM